MPVLDRKLVMLAGALVTEPDLLLMDEPIGGLTPPEIELFERSSRPRFRGTARLSLSST